MARALREKLEDGVGKLSVSHGIHHSIDKVNLYYHYHIVFSIRMIR